MISRNALLARKVYSKYDTDINKTAVSQSVEFYWGPITAIK